MIELYELILLVLVTVVIYWNVPDAHRLSLLVIACGIYVVYQDYLSFLILVLLSLSTYLLLKRRRASELPIYLSLLLSTGLFIAFKWSTTYELGVFDAVLPLGMSFYLFRLIHFSLEVYKRNITHFSLKELIGYLFFLPVILIGPIIRFPDWKKEFKRSRWDAQLIANGFERMLYGLVKIVVLGNYFVNIKLNELISMLAETDLWLSNYLECLRYAANSYLLFAGYSDVAVGAAMLFGYRIMENFKFPFLARSINDFWNRWHISLSSWCRDYVFMPVVSATRIYWLAILASMLVLGLWHEFSWRYVSWATFHVAGIIIWYMYNNYLGHRIAKSSAYELLSWFITINFVIVSFAFLKERSIEQSLHVLGILLGIST